MKKITMQQFLVRQPDYMRQASTDTEYLNIANTLLAVAERLGYEKIIPVGLVQRMALTVIEYYQDIIADSGIWRSFIDECEYLYKKRLPFYDIPDDYVLYELNEVDVRFLIWYVWAMCSEDFRLISPDRKEIADLSVAWHEVLESIYEDVSVPESYHFARELELNAESNPDEIYKLGKWLFMNCYLMTPAYSQTLSMILEDPEFKADPNNFKLIQNKIEASMIEDPTGPLALYIKEWLYLIIEGKIPHHMRDDKSGSDKPDHPYYSAFIKATGGIPIKFLGSYEELNKFFIDVLGWQEGEDHLPQMKKERNFVLLVNREKGMLLAKNICENIKHPDNPYYDREFARIHAIEMLTVRGCCPADLLKYLYEHDCVVDATFSDSDNFKLVKDNFDFISRCYLQQYYRGD